jgi:hypothetical protein
LAWPPCEPVTACRLLVRGRTSSIPCRTVGNLKRHGRGDAASLRLFEGCVCPRTKDTATHGISRCRVMRDHLNLTEARRRAADIARETATLRADAAWKNAYSATFQQVYDETLAQLLTEQETDAVA